MGFGFVELGTVTPKPQPGNSKPRLFRLRQDLAIINRMGFNSGGVDRFVQNFKALKPSCIAGINLGKNATTPNEQALDDYRVGMQATYPLADYLTINISSPNTKNLRQLQQGDDLRDLLAGLGETRKALQDKYQQHKPIALKIAPDLQTEEIS